MAPARMTSAPGLHVGKTMHRQHFTQQATTVTLLIIQTALILTLLTSSCECVPKRKNVLLIVADDLRPQLPVYKSMAKELGLDPFPNMWTPNIDELAEKSLVLGRSYSQAPICSPSRASFLTGRRPDTTKVHDKNTYWRKAGGDFTTMPQFFKEKGYLSIGMGKIFHSGEASGRDDDSPSWSLDKFPYYHADSQPYWRQHNKDLSYKSVDTNFSKYTSELKDEELAEKAVETLKTIADGAKKGEVNFFMGVGFRLPHLPWVVPDTYLSYYPDDSIVLPTNPDPPSDMPDIAWYNRPELKDYEDIANLKWRGIPGSKLPDVVVKRLRRYYYASVSYIDNQVGRILKELEDQRLSDNTIVVFMSDHGYFLGEHGLWAKNTNFELALHVPLMVHVPGITESVDVSLRLVELIDLFPTLVELTDFDPLPKCPENVTANALTKLCREGSSFAPLLEDPAFPLGKSAAFSQVYRSSSDVSCDGVMGYTVRTYQYRYTEWITVDRHSKEPVWISKQGVELYDHMNDPQENKNLAKVNTMPMRILKQELSALLREGWRSKGALPQSDWPWTVTSTGISFRDYHLALITALCFTLGCVSLF